MQADHDTIEANKRLTIDALTALIELDPISSPTSGFCFELPNIFWPFLAARCRQGFSRRLTPFAGVRLAHLSLHPAVQHRLTKLPTTAQLKSRNDAVADIAIERVR